MSLILDALNRADQERNQENSTPNLHSGHNLGPQPTRPIRRWLIEGVIIALAVAAIIYSVFIQQQNSPKGSPAPAKEADTPTHSVPQMLTAKPKAEPVASLIQQTPEATAAVAEQATPASAIIKPDTEIKTAPTTNSAISSLYQQQTPVPEVKPATDPKPPITAPEPEDDGQSILQQIPLLAQMPTRFQRAIPSIDYTVHVYSDSERAGFVNLNGSIRKIGAEIVPGLLVIAILKDSVVLDYNGTQFRLLALNSWVNF